MNHSAHIENNNSEFYFKYDVTHAMNNDIDVLTASVFNIQT